jgi:hypothetical protein
MKSGRLLRGQRLIGYNVTRNRLFNYAVYTAAIVIGVAAGLLAQVVYNAALASESSLQVLFNQGYNSFLFSLPTIILVFTLVFTMLQQIQRSGVRFTYQVPYWLPVTWEEHTVASILAELLGLPLMAVTAISSAVLVFSLFVGQTLFTVSTILAMVGAAFMASATAEVFRILQMRFTGAVYKSTGRAAVWVRFISSLLFFAVFYIVYFYIINGVGPSVFVQTVASAQSAAWFVPYVWLGLTLYSLASGLLLQGTAFLALSLLFIVGLVVLGVALNKRYGLYEPPAITISRGIYTPKTGFLGKLGFSSVEAALVRKELKAFTRRRELMPAFILPIIFLVIPIMSSVNGAQNSQSSSAPEQFWFAFTTLFPVAVMAMSLGNFMTGEEGQNIWRIYASPISAKNFVKSKYAFMLFFSLIVLPITGTIGFLIYHPSLSATFTLVTESVFVAFTVGALSLANGIKGADFTEAPRPRMIRVEWSFINLLTCAVSALAVLAPLIPYIIVVFSRVQISGFLELYQAAIISGVIAAVLAVIFYKVAVGNARELLAKAEL